MQEPSLLLRLILYAILRRAVLHKGKTALGTLGPLKANPYHGIFSRSLDGRLILAHATARAFQRFVAFGHKRDARALIRPRMSFAIIISFSFLLHVRPHRVQWPGYMRVDNVRAALPRSRGFEGNKLTTIYRKGKKKGASVSITVTPPRKCGILNDINRPSISGRVGDTSTAWE